MNLESFIADPRRHASLAEHVGTSKAWLWQIATGWRGKRASTELAIAIERASLAIGPEAVSRASLRPDIWAPAEKDSGDLPAATAGGVEAKCRELEVVHVHGADAAPNRDLAA